MGEAERLDDQEAAPERRPTSSPPDSIAAQVAARIDGLPAMPGDPGDWAAAAAACEREAAGRGQGHEAAALLHQAGRIHEERLDDPEAALAAYESAVAADPGHLPSLQAARRIAAEWGYSQRECRFLEAEARVTTDPSRVAALDYARARLLASSLERPEEARALLAEAAARNPGHLPLLGDHGRLAAADGRLDELLADWIESAAAAEGPAAAQMLCAAAALAEERLGRPDEAADLAMAAFRQDPSDPAARTLALRHAERLGRDADRAALLAADGRAAQDPRAAALALLQLARVEAERGEPGRAREALADAARRAPHDPAVLAAQARDAERREAWDELAELLQARIDEHRLHPGADASELAAAEVRLAEVYEQRLGQPEEALDCYRSALAVEPAHRPALAALGRLHAARGEWEQVLETFLAERDASDDAREQAQKCFKAGELLEERLDRPASAAGLYAEALRLDPGLLAAARAQERLLERLERYPELCDHLEHELEATADPSQSVAVLFRLARLREDRLADLDGAATCYRRVLQLEPGNVLALRSLAVVLERGGRKTELAEALEQAAAAAAPREAVALLTRAGEVREDAGDEAGAAAAWERALASDPTHLPALRALGRLCARAGRWEELVDMCRAEAAALHTAGAAAALLVRVGEILETRLGQPGEAVAAWREALALVPGHGPSLQALARVHRARQEWEPLVEVLAADASARQLPHERAALLFEAGELAERRVGDARGAINLYQQVVNADPGFTPAHRALQRLLAEQAQWVDLAAACQLEADHAEGAERVAALLRQAWVCAERLGDADDARAACQAVFEVHPGHAGAAMLLDRLGGTPDGALRAHMAERVSDPRVAAPMWVAAGLDQRLSGGDPWPDLLRAADLDPDDPVAGPAVDGHLRTEGRHAERAALWERREPTAADPLGRAEAALRAAEAWEDAGEDDRAGSAYHRALAAAPGLLPALQGLRRLRARARDWPGVHEALRAEAAASRDGAAAAGALAQACEVALVHLADRGIALQDLREAQERAPGDLKLAERMVGLLRDSERATDLCELRETRARAEPLPARAAEEWLAAARVAVDQLGDRTRALADLDRALQLRPALAPALFLRGRLRAAAGRAAEAVRDLTASLQLGSDVHAQVPAHLELAALHQGLLADRPRAMSHLNAVLAASPDNPVALARLAHVHREARNWPAAADTLRRLIALPGLAPAEKVPRLLELSEVRADGFGDAAAATALCEQALELAPADPAALDQLARIREQAEDLPGLAAALIRIGREGKDPARRVAARMRAARILAGSLQAPDRAADLLREALAEEPHSVTARQALAEVLAGEDPAEAVEQHRVLLEGDPGRVESWRALFRLYHRTRQHDRAFVAAGVLRFLRAADEATEAPFFAQNVSHAPLETVQVLAPEDWEALRHPLDRGPLSELLSLTGEHLSKLAVEGPRTGSRTRPGHPVRRLLDELAHTLGAQEFELLEEPDGDGLALEPAPTARVRVGAAFGTRHPVPAQRFLLARVAARLRAGNALADHFGPGRLGELLVAAVRQAVPDFQGIADPGEELERVVGRVLPRRLRRPIEKLAGPLATQRTGLIAWFGAMHASADRAGLLLAGDLPSALRVALHDGGRPPAQLESAGEIQAAVQARPDLQALLRFAASEEHLRLRQRLRLAIA